MTPHSTPRISSPLADQRRPAPHRRRPVRPLPASWSRVQPLHHRLLRRLRLVRRSSTSPPCCDHPHPARRPLHPPHHPRRRHRLPPGLALPEPYLSSDIYRYVWDGIVQHAHISPLPLRPRRPRAARSSARPPATSSITSTAATTPTPSTRPPPRSLFYLVTSISPTVPAMKTVMVLFEGVTLYALIQLLAASASAASRPSSTPGARSLIWEIAGSGHLDSAAMAFIALALLARAPPPTHPHRPLPRPRHHDQVLPDRPAPRALSRATGHEGLHWRMPATSPPSSPSATPPTPASACSSSASSAATPRKKA